MTVASAVGQVQENSPAQQAGLEPYFDFIITIGHSRLVRLPHATTALCVCVSPLLQQAPLCSSSLLFWRDAQLTSSPSRPVLSLTGALPSAQLLSFLGLLELATRCKGPASQGMRGVKVRRDLSERGGLQCSGPSRLFVHSVDFSRDSERGRFRGA